ncbi:hypothetical protein OSTOST_23875, partial [Ostertagia ostertagi]
MQWNHVNMINYYCPSWEDNNLLMVNDSTNFWNVYEVDVGPEFKERNVFPVDHEIGYPLWQFADRPYASNGSCIVS